MKEGLKGLTIFGSTGSIGTQTLEIIRRQGGYRVTALSAYSNVALMEAQIREFKPEVAVMYSEAAALDLKNRVSDTPVRVLSGMEGLIEIATLDSVDTVVAALVGMIGIRPTIAAIKAGKTIALANKETLVTAGHIIMPLAKEMNVPILPVDSEHSAIFQSMNGETHGEIRKILLTASGGPFRGRKREDLADMRAEDALKHPNWSMGKKVTIDSATLVNKGLEVIEAKWLFDVDASDIEVVIQPESIVHSMVEYRDGAVIAQLGVPDMKLPIQYALFYPKRMPMEDNRLDFYKLSEIHFEKPDRGLFKGLDFAYNAIEAGGNMPTVFNAANEVAVERFLKGEIGFLQIYDYIERAMESIPFVNDPDLDAILETEARTRDFLK
ncbi:MAG: 1-deoxy-D-xylulose-5-phosphate reductoisomerase [Lachnospiraceae bacterium]|nr:1-deoxy-D-xylulose-5-phosphate reductoisomerase [Lachnospiraceae bacterium]